MSAEGQRKKETTKTRMGIASVPPAIINRFTMSSSAAIAHLNKTQYTQTLITLMQYQEHEMSEEKSQYP